MRSEPGGPAPGSEQEFACFYREQFRGLVGYLLYQGAQLHLAVDLAQDAMITAHQRWNTIRSPRAYVYKVAYMAFLRRDLTELPTEEVPEQSSVLPHPEEAEAWLQKHQVIEMLRALPPRQRQVLALTLDGWSPADTADLLGIASQAVRSSLKQARRNAAEYLRRIREEEK
jgi:RNA polymerase sigma-70 factor (ECF subfamily)